mgnify:FL=1
MTAIPLRARPTVVTTVTEADDGFDEVFRSLVPDVRRLTERILGDAASAEDATAEAFIRALTRWRRVKGLPHRDAWIMRVAANVALDELRRRKRRPVADPGRTEATAPETDPSSRLDVCRALAELPRRQREVLVLHHLAGLPEAEVADALGVSINTVKTHGARGIAQLRDRWGHDLEGGPDADR